MGLEAVKEEIIRSAKQQESAMLAEARKESNRILKEAEAKIEELRAKSDAETKKTIEVIKKQTTAASNMESKKMLLEAKKEVIEMIFAEVKKRLETLDDKKREWYIKRLIDKARNELEIALVYCNKKSAKFVKEFTAEPIDIAGGLIAENKEGTIRLDYSFETMLESIRDSELQSVNKLLFN
ncbi:MAG: V-type ATP synthase subunit E family protein [Nanoarchaeota archaeon]